MTRFAALLVVLAACGEGQHCFDSSGNYCYCQADKQGLDPSTKMECLAQTYSNGYCCANKSLKLCECSGVKCITSATDCNCVPSWAAFGGQTPMDDRCMTTFAHCCNTGGLCTCSDKVCSGGAYEVSHCDDATLFDCNEGARKVDACGKEGGDPAW